MSRQAEPALGDVAPAASSAVLLIALLALALIFPVAALASAALLAGARSKSTKVHAAVAGGLLTAILGWLNVGKSISGDWGWYTRHYELLTYLPLSEYIGHRIPPFTIRSTEPVYYTVAWLLAGPTHGNAAVLAVTITALIYGPLCFALSAFVGVIGSTPGPRFVGIVAGALFGVSFTLSTHLVRQEIAAALALLSLALAFTGRHRLAALALVTAGLTHNSVLVPVALMYVAAIFVVHRERIVSSRLVLALACVAATGLSASRLVGSSGYTGRSDGSVSLLVVAFDAALLLTLIQQRRSFPDHLHRLVRTLFAFYILQATLVLSLYALPIPELRMYLYVEAVRAAAAALLAALWIGQARTAPARAVLSMAVLGGAALFVEARIAVSPFIYEGGGLFAHLFRPLLLI